ncbi:MULTISPECIES: lipopolysaccharide biosynthesis protein [Bacillus cereus group]|uniref:lipopolysaccharide biosynthesis protein n=1 Tax=Bacillus cereus group TaxID=86661 RepID=UPI0018F47D0C|nr:MULTISPECIES: oligosaccharide flippase family protein [Bacillus cereus group]MBJ8093623.1 oligosaccharide flippase family protein [Bacillus cereus]CAH2463313.1 polysaccharide biosynthetic process [Bacillus mycoides KBAB4]
MNYKVKKFARNFSYTFIANILSIIISTVLLLVVPRFIDVSNYGYWQLYIFYSSYISYMSLGLTDGAYLRYGGWEYSDLRKPIFVSQYWFLVVFDIIANSAILLYYISIATDTSKTMVVALTCLTGVLVVPRSLLTFMLQATNRIKEFSIIIILERSIYFILVIAFLMNGVKEFEYLILADVIGKISSVIYSFVVCRELVFGKFESIKTSAKEIYVNISVGSKLLFANFASLLIIGIVRFFIERNWSIEIFGKISLTLSIANMLLLFINAIAVVLFPALRRTSQENLPFIYKTIRTTIMIPLVGLLVFYYPAKVILSAWLPQYADSLIYMALLFPMCLYESKMLLLINTYLKTLRKEKWMLIINLITVAMSLVLTCISVFVLNSLNLTILCIILLLAFRCIVAEIYLARLLNIKVKKDIILEVIITIIFIVISWYLSVISALLIYLTVYTIYLMIKKNDIIDLWRNIKILIKSK